ncbi:MAG: MBL fold metallo-hydrolase [Planctomycetota bacterium]|nr:MBL fold metallo-hydrolase [Planctomycetota bacterium]MDA1113578.1 MBL fold metallo-hydrolase [Planctomycetota bacterium]
MRITFHGAAREVTGSCHQIFCGKSSILVDCGLFQGGGRDRNADAFQFKPSEIDAVVLTHAHIDHSGRLPLLAKRGFSGPIYAHPATRDLCKILLRDSAFIHEKDAEWENRRRASKGEDAVEPLYSQEDAERVMRQFKTIPYAVEQQILTNFSVCFRDAGHILGSSIAELTVGTGARSRKLVFSGDLGHTGTPILRDPEYVKQADLVLMESTYGDREHRMWDATWSELGEIFNTANHENGNILIPAFAVGRTQELLYAFQQHFEEWNLARWKIYLDSPLAIEATQIYRDHQEVYDAEANAAVRKEGASLDLANLEFCPDAEDSMRLNEMKSGAIIIAGSGMCTGGRIRHHLKHHGVRESCQVIMVGFQAEGTLGRILVDGKRDVRIYGEDVHLAAKFHTIGGLSAHADATGLASWYGFFENRPPLVLIHGEKKAMDSLADRLQKEFSPPRLLCPEPGESVDLEQLLGLPASA